MSRELKRVLASDPALSQALRTLPRRPAPLDFTQKLRMMARRERLQRTPWARMHAFCREWMSHSWAQIHLSFENVMRPMAVPVMGGVFSAVTLFNLGVAPAYPVIARSATAVRLDVPTKLSTEAYVAIDLKSGGLNSIVQGDLVLEVLVDDNGRMMEYSVVEGTPLSARDRRKLEEGLLGVRFQPATSFGKPTMTRLRLWISNIEVKG
jgi:hypothetical protein